MCGAYVQSSILSADRFGILMFEAHAWRERKRESKKQGKYKRIHLKQITKQRNPKRRNANNISVKTNYMKTRGRMEKTHTVFKPNAEDLFKLICTFMLYW